MRDSLVIAGSIVAGSTIVAAGLFFGLRDRAAPSGAVVAGPGGPPTSVAPPVTQVRADLSAWAADEASKALEAQKPDLLRSCWDPALEKAPTPSTSRYHYSVSFDPTGKQIAQGISEVMGDSRGDVAACLRARPMTLVIPPPGAFVSVDVRVSFP
jgi:hypothetical protein